jgi:ribulose bisphosphate carboxylase small subunit
MTTIELITEIEAWLSFNNKPSKEEIAKLRKSIKDHLAEQLRIHDVIKSVCDCTSKDLANHFIDCFNIDMDKNTYFFAVADKPNEKGAFLVELK